MVDEVGSRISFSLLNEKKTGKYGFLSNFSA